MNEESLKAGLFSKRRVGTNILRYSFASDIHNQDDIPWATYKACVTQLAHSLQTNLDFTKVHSVLRIIPWDEELTFEGRGGKEGQQIFINPMTGQGLRNSC